jgi:glycosyltransferase involved in cell wall biosynthesis
VIPALSIGHGGDSRACAELCESVARLGLEVSLAYFGEAGVEEFHPEGVTLYRCEPARGKLGALLAFSRQMGTVLKQQVPQSDLVHVHGIWRYLGFAAAREALRHSVPYIVQPHGSLHPWKMAHKRLRKWVYGTLLERWVLKRAQAIHAESVDDKRQILQYIPGAKILVVPSGAYPARLALPVSFGDLSDRWPALRGYRTVLYLSRLDVNKGIDILIKALHEVGAVRSAWRLLVIGPDYSGTRPRMEEMTRRLGIAEQVIWAGMVTEEEKRLALQKCDFFVLPSLSENFGIAVLEALLCSRPVVTTTEMPWARVEEMGAGARVPPTVEGLSRGLTQLMRLPKAQLDLMGQRGYRFAAREFDWAAIAPRMRDVYTEIVRETESRRLGKS